MLDGTIDKSDDTDKGYTVEAAVPWKSFNKAKKTLIANREEFSARHLPPYIEELQTLINFPSRLVKEIIKMRLSYANKLKEQLAQQGVLRPVQLVPLGELPPKSVQVHDRSRYRALDRAGRARSLEHRSVSMH